jgi:hypothetical protein
VYRPEPRANPVAWGLRGCEIAAGFGDVLQSANVVHEHGNALAKVVQFARRVNPEVRTARRNCRRTAAAFVDLDSIVA